MVYGQVLHSFLFSQSFLQNLELAAHTIKSTTEIGNSASFVDVSPHLFRCLA